MKESSRGMASTIDGAPQRVLIVSASMGAGHDGAARELRSRLSDRGYEVEIVDFLDLLWLRLGTALRWLYQLQLRALPWTYEVTYRVTPVLRAPTVIVDDWLSRRRFRRVVNTFRPAVIVSVYPLSSLVLGRMRRTGRLRVPVVTYLTDFSVHALWVERGVDRHLAISTPSAQFATTRGARDAVARGPLVGWPFHTAGQPERAAMRSRLGLTADTRAVLVVAGSWGVGEISATVDVIASVDEFHLIVVCGRNETLRDTLQSKRLGTIIGWTDEMPALMAAADVLVENAGGLTCMEAFASRLPVVTFRPIPGHGRENARTMASYGVCRYAHDSGGLLATLRELTDRGATRGAMVAKAHALFVEDPSRDVEELARQSVDSGDTPILRSSAVPRRMVAAASALVMLYGLLTLGTQTVVAFGVGTARPPHTTASTIYVGVRLGDELLTDQPLLNELRASGATAIVDEAAARGHTETLVWLTGHGVEIANGGSGHGTWLRPARARRDLQEAEGLIAKETGTRPTDFVPGRRLDAFDLYYAESTEQQVVVPDATFGPAHLPALLKAGRVYVLDGRSGDPAAVMSALAAIEDEAAAMGIHVAPLKELR